MKINRNTFLNKIIKILSSLVRVSKNNFCTKVEIL